MTQQAQRTETGRETRRSFALGEEQRQYDHEVLDVARVVRVVKGGRRFSFRASVVAGNRSGVVGFGLGKSRDVQTAIQKAYEKAVKNVMKTPVVKGTIPYETMAKYGSAKVMMRPAKPGTGIIAGSTVRIVADLAGITDLVSKRLGSTNKVNTAKAAIKGLSELVKTK
jgi:small subunit ribosomal protein S5